MFFRFCRCNFLINKDRPRGRCLMLVPNKMLLLTVQHKGILAEGHRLSFYFESHPDYEKKLLQIQAL